MAWDEERAEIVQAETQKFEEATGGYAYPTHPEVYLSGGMTLRDWYAGQALAGISRPIVTTQSEEKFCEEAARYAVTMADAMLKALRS